MDEAKFGKGPEDKEGEARLQKLILQVQRLSENLETFRRRTSIGTMLGKIIIGQLSEEGSTVEEEGEAIDQEMDAIQEELSRSAEHLGIAFQAGDADSGAAAIFSGEGAYVRQDLYFVVQDQKKYLDNIRLLAESAGTNEEAKEMLSKLLDEHARTSLRFVDDTDTLISQFASLKTISEEVPQELLPEKFSRIAYYAKRGIIKDGAMAMTMDHMFFLVGCGDITFENIQKEEEKLLKFIDDIKNKAPESRVLAIELLSRFIERINNNEKMWEEWGEDTEREFIKKTIDGVGVMTTKLDQILADLKAEEG